MPEVPQSPIKQKPSIQGQVPPEKKQKLPVIKPEQSPEKKKPKSPPKPKKDEDLKYEMIYVNGGFNNGVELKPASDGKVELSIAIYGGGEKKTLGISPLPPSIAKLMKAYEVGAASDANTPEITDELKRYFAEINQSLSMKVIDILKEADEKVKAAIKSTFRETNQGF